ncbi:MAG: hypothetical protein F4065_00275 [Rhodothermaceae bacterium]|nr:hypothetical protein [Rhodothermaceae bacterium]MXZ58343.1 hypothetical protein [Rhodothermaceae bacterium]MYB91145.1 hypothetical protein [Rhodothermaceae bacterium]MYD67194.1 hypothetical protein [Rhodothermaceae bacterium]MYG44572.1 hypothetical protein [Rhodothermaceae bacterium]
MELKNDLEDLGILYRKYENKSISEAKTEAWFIRPFLKSLGYDSSNPELVDPQYPADPKDIKPGKVDYALLRNGSPIIFVEAKKLHESLDHHVTINQIKGYFHFVREVDFVILTNGNEYRFFTDMDHENMLDEEPFLVFRLSELDQETLEYLEQFSRRNFDSTKLRALAYKLSHGDKIYAFLKEQLLSPSDEFAGSVSKMLFGTTKRKIRDHVKKSLPDAFSRLINAKIQTPIMVTPGEEQDPVETRDPNSTEHPIIAEQSKEQDPFKIETKFTKLDYFRFQDEIVSGTWTDMFVYILSALCQRDRSRLISSFAAKKTTIVARDPKLIKRNCISIGNGLFTTTNNGTREKIRYLRTALTSFDMRDTLRVKLKEK